MVPTSLQEHASIIQLLIAQTILILHTALSVKHSLQLSTAIHNVNSVQFSFRTALNVITKLTAPIAMIPGSSMKHNAFLAILLYLIV